MSFKVSRTLVNFWLDCALLVVFLLLSWTAVVVQFLFPPGPEASGWTLWGQDYVWWSDFRFGLLSTLGLGILVHVMLHWSWVCGVVATRIAGKRRAPQDDGSNTLWGVGLLIAIVNVVGVAVAAAALSISPPI